MDLLNNNNNNNMFRDEDCFFFYISKNSPQFVTHIKLKPASMYKII